MDDARLAGPDRKRSRWAARAVTAEIASPAVGSRAGAVTGAGPLRMRPEVS